MTRYSRFCRIALVGVALVAEVAACTGASEGGAPLAGLQDSTAQPSAPTRASTAPSAAALSRPSVSAVPEAPSPVPSVAAVGRPSVTAVPRTPSPARQPSAAAGSGWPIRAALVDRVIQLAAAKSGAKPAAILVISAEAMTWDSGALGCPKIGVAYTPARVTGYRVVVSADGLKLDYRGGRSGDPRLCQRPWQGGGG